VEKKVKITSDQRGRLVEILIESADMFAEDRKFKEAAFYEQLSEKLSKNKKLTRNEKSHVDDVFDMFRLNEE
jgi:hypothetical protein